MADLSDQSEAYFASLNPLTKKIFKDLDNYKKTFGERWDEFTLEKQEELLDKFIVDPRLSEKYLAGSRNKEHRSVFPKYRIDCGEKVVVDFENEDDWNTHRDEHSGPFSWRTRSQQDLTLDEDLLSPGEERKTRNKRSRSPDILDNGKASTLKPEKNGWESPYTDVARQDADAKDEIFRKFGISFGTDDEEIDEPDTNDHDQLEPVETEESSLLPPGDELGNDNFVFEDIQANSPSVILASRNSALQSEELSFVTDHEKSPDTQFMLEIGESSTDPDDNRLSTHSAVTEQPAAQTSLNDWMASPTKCDEELMTKSGFDFLDNW